MSQSDSDILQTMDNSVHRQRVQWKPAEEIMLTTRIQSNPYFVNILAAVTHSSQPLILKDKKLWQRLADEHNAELSSKGTSCMKPRTSKSIRDKWRYKLSPCVRNSWNESDWGMLEELLPPHFWKSTSGRRKYNHWQHTFNGWVELEGSAPSIQIMKNIMEKVKKCVKSGSNSYKAMVPGLYEIACYIISTTCTSLVVDASEYSLPAKHGSLPRPSQYSKGEIQKGHMSKSVMVDFFRNSSIEAVPKEELPRVSAWTTGQPPGKAHCGRTENMCQDFPLGVFDDVVTHPKHLDNSECFNLVMESCRDKIHVSS